MFFLLPPILNEYLSEIYTNTGSLTSSPKVVPGLAVGPDYILIDVYMYNGAKGSVDTPKRDLDLIH